MKKFAGLIAFLVPLVAFALDLSGMNLPYPDVRAGTPEATAISLLTSEGVVRGYPDGMFRPFNTLNRAEFMKIVIESAYENFSEAYRAPLERCFPDVPTNAWYHAYACFAKEQDIVSGYPDAKLPQSQWLLKPEKPVNYAEALKILDELYDYTLDHEPGEAWFLPYYRAAQKRGTALPVALKLDLPLTRVYMARLAAAFIAESKGLLAEYRSAELGISSSSSTSSSSSSTSSSSSSSVSSSSSSSSSSSAQSSPFTLPSVSHFLVVGTKTDAIANGVIKVTGESARIQIVEVTTFNEIPAVQKMELTTQTGMIIATLLRRTTTSPPDYKQYYDAQVQLDQAYRMPMDVSVPVVLRAVVSDLNNNGASDQLVHVRTFKITAVGDASHDSFNYTIAAPFPPHQTSFGRIVSVKSVGPASGQLKAGTGLTVATFSVSGAVITGKTLSIENLLFTLTKTDRVTLKKIKLSTPSGAMDCTLGVDGVKCDGIPALIGTIGSVPLVLTLKADVEISAGPGLASLQADLRLPGAPNEFGAIQWTDQSGHFKWAEGVSPLAKGTLWQ